MTASSTSVRGALSAAFTAFSPARLVFAATMTGQPEKEGQVLRRMAPLALSPWGLVLLQALRPWVVGG